MHVLSSSTVIYHAYYRSYFINSCGTRNCYSFSNSNIAFLRVRRVCVSAWVHIDLKRLRISRFYLSRQPKFGVRIYRWFSEPRNEKTVLTSRLDVYCSGSLHDTGAVSTEPNGHYSPPTHSIKRASPLISLVTESSAEVHSKTCAVSDVSNVHAWLMFWALSNKALPRLCCLFGRNYWTTTCDTAQRILIIPSFVIFFSKEVNSCNHQHSPVLRYENESAYQGTGSEWKTGHGYHDAFRARCARKWVLIKNGVFQRVYDRIADVFVSFGVWFEDALHHMLSIRVIQPGTIQDCMNLPWSPARCVVNATKHPRRIMTETRSRMARKKMSLQFGNCNGDVQMEATRENKHVRVGGAGYVCEHEEMIFNTSVEKGIEWAIYRGTNMAGLMWVCVR